MTKPYMNKTKMELLAKEGAFSDMYQMLKQLGFVYEKKEQLMLPYYNLIKQNWCRLQEKNGCLIHITNISQPHEKLATCSSWRSSMNNWYIQHGIANQIRLFLYAISCECNWLAEQISTKYIQCWFQTQNAIMNKVCNLVKTRQNEGNYFSEVLYYLSWTPMEMEVNKQWHTSSYTTNQQKELKDFIIQQKGLLYYYGEEIESDPFFALINRQYQEIGLERSRDILMVYKGNWLKAVILRYIGPQGINFSFLENRIEIIVDTASKSESELFHAIGNAIHEMGELQGFSPIVVNHVFSDMLESVGAQKLRLYTRFLLTKTAIRSWISVLTEKYSLSNWNNE